jgi:hypothetical protein
VPFELHLQSIVAKFARLLNSLALKRGRFIKPSHLSVGGGSRVSQDWFALARGPERSLGNL